MNTFYKKARFTPQLQTDFLAKYGVATAKVKRRKSHQEDDLQTVCVRWFEVQFPRLSKYLVHVPNGAALAKKKNKDGKWYCPEMARLKAMGLRPGFPDLVLFVPIKSYPGLIIELKFGKNVLSNEQKEYRDLLIAMGYKWEECRTFERFQDIIKGYLS